MNTAIELLEYTAVGLVFLVLSIITIGALLQAGYLLYGML